MRSAMCHELSRTQPKLEGKCVSVGVDALAVAWCTKTRCYVIDGSSKNRSVFVRKLPRRGFVSIAVLMHAKMISVGKNKQQKNELHATARTTAPFVKHSSSMPPFIKNKRRIFVEPSELPVVYEDSALADLHPMRHTYIHLTLWTLFFKARKSNRHSQDTYSTTFFATRANEPCAHVGKQHTTRVPNINPTLQKLVLALAMHDQKITMAKPARASCTFRTGLARPFETDLLFPNSESSSLC